MGAEFPIPDVEFLISVAPSTGLIAGDCRRYAPRSARISDRRARHPEATGPVPPPADTRRPAEGEDDLRSPDGHQPVLQQLPRPDDAPEAAGGGARGDTEVRRRFGLGP